MGLNWCGMMTNSNNFERLIAYPVKTLWCSIFGHVWENHETYVPVRAGPLFSTICKRCGIRGNLWETDKYAKGMDMGVVSSNFQEGDEFTYFL